MRDCRNCGKHRDDHHFENGELFCYINANRSLYRDEPHEQAIIRVLLDSASEDEVKEIRNEWKIKNGHDVNEEGE